MHAGAEADKFAFAQILRETETSQEKKLWAYLSNRPKGYKFRRQHPFKFYVVDFYCHRERLVIELDGRHHKFNVEYDKDRTKIIEEYGLNVVRFENSEIDDDFEETIRKIDALLE